MASIRKKLSMALGFNSEASPSISKSNTMDMNRGSIDSGYHSMIAKPKHGSQGGLSQTTTFVKSDTKSSPEHSPKKLHKAISMTFSGAMQAFSNTVRSTTSYIYPTPGEPDLPSSEWAECETPKKKSRRSSIMSSVRSRKQRFTPRARDDKNGSPEMPNPPMTQEKAHALDVAILNPSLSYASSGRSSTSRGAQLLAGVKLPAAAKNLWPGPTRMNVDQAFVIDGRRTLHPASPNFDDPYLEKEDGLQHGLPVVTSASEFALESPSPEAKKRYLNDERGYLSEVESNADVSESDGLAPACLRYVAPGSLEARTSSPCRHKNPAESHVYVTSSTSPCLETIPSRMPSSVRSRPQPSKLETLDGTAAQTASLHTSSRTCSHLSASLEDGLNALFPSYKDSMMSKSRLLDERLPLDVYDADAESLESSMGSRAAWERHRADRERRYMEIVDMAPTTESDEEVRPELELKRSPSKKPVHYAEELVQSSVNVGVSESLPRYPTGDLRYAVEAIERSAFPIGDLAYAVEAIDRPSVTTFEPLETVFQQRPMLSLSEAIDEHDALRVSDPQKLSQSRMEVTSSPPADLSPSRVKLPSSPESSPVDISAAPKYTVMTMRLTDEELMTSRTGNLDGQSISRFSCESTDVSANSSPEQQSCAAPEDAYEAGLKAGSLSVPTYLSRSTETIPVGEDAYEAGLRAAGISMRTYPLDVVQAKHVMDNSYEGDLRATSFYTPIFKETSQVTYCEQLETGSTLPKLRSRNVSPFEHSRTVSALSDDTDDSCAITKHSPSCNASPPFPSLQVRSEPARRIPSAIDALATHRDEQTRIAGPANTGINPSVPSPLDGTNDQNGEAGSKPFSEFTNSPDKHAQATWLEQHDLQSPSPDTTSSIQSLSNSTTPLETLNAAKMPSFVSPSLIASRKARRKQKKGSSGMGSDPFADITMNPRNAILESHYESPKREFNKNSIRDKTQKSPCESARVAGGSVPKPSPNRRLGNPNCKSKSSKESPGGKRKAAVTLAVTSSPPRMKIPQAGCELSSGEIHEDAGSTIKDSGSRLEPKFSIKDLPW